MLHTFVALTHDKPGVLTRTKSLLRRGFFLLFTSGLVVPVFAQSRSIRVRVVDGDTGKPIQAEAVSLYDTSRGSDTREIPGERLQGSFRFEVQPFMQLKLGQVRTGQNIRGSFDPCYQDSHRSDIYFSPDAIVKTGVVSPNHCKASITAQPTPGELLIFVQHMSPWKRMLGALDK